MKKTSRSAAGSGPPAVDFELTTLLGFVIFRLSSSLGSLAERHAQETADLTLAEYRCLVALATHGGMGVTPLCQVLHIDKAWVSRTLARLVQRGLAASAADPADARRTIFNTTPRGSQTAKALIARAVRRQARLLAGFSAGEVQQLLQLMNRMQANADALRDEG